MGVGASYSVRLHNFCITIPRCYKDAYVNSFSPYTAGLWNSQCIECFPLTCDLNGFKSRIDRHLLRLCLKKFRVCLNLFTLLLLGAPCLVVAVQPCIEWISIKKRNALREQSICGIKGGGIKVCKLDLQNFKNSEAKITKWCIRLENTEFKIVNHRSLVLFSQTWHLLYISIDPKTR